MTFAFPLTTIVLRPLPVRKMELRSGQVTGPSADHHLDSSSHQHEQGKNRLTWPSSSWKDLLWPKEDSITTHNISQSFPATASPKDRE